VREPRKLKRVALKEELVELTGDTISAIILQQLIFLTGMRRDFDEFMEEERRRAAAHGEEPDMPPLTSGWVYKTQSELIKDSLITSSRQTAERKLSDLVENKWVDKRNNPRDRRDRTLQYRVNLVKIRDDLMAMGYPLEGYDLPEKAEQCMVQNGPPNVHIEHDNVQNGRALPEITTEITTEKKTETEKEKEKEDCATLVRYLEKKETLPAAVLVKERLTRYMRDFPQFFSPSSDVDVVATALVNEQLYLHQMRAHTPDLCSKETALKIENWFAMRYGNPDNSSYARGDVQYFNFCMKMKFLMSRTPDQLAGKNGFHMKMRKMFFELDAVGATAEDYREWLRKRRKNSAKSALCREVIQMFCSSFGEDLVCREA